MNTVGVISPEMSGDKTLITIASSGTGYLQPVNFQPAVTDGTSFIALIVTMYDIVCTYINYYSYSYRLHSSTTSWVYIRRAAAVSVWITVLNRVLQYNDTCLDTTACMQFACRVRSTQINTITSNPLRF